MSVKIRREGPADLAQQEINYIRIVELIRQLFPDEVERIYFKQSVDETGKFPLSTLIFTRVIPNSKISLLAKNDYNLYHDLPDSLSRFMQERSFNAQAGYAGYVIDYKILVPSTQEMIENLEKDLYKVYSKSFDEQVLEELGVDDE